MSNKPKPEQVQAVAALRARVKALELAESECKRALETLRQSEAKWRSLVENAPDFIATLSPDGTVLYANRTVPGLTVEEVVGTNVCKHIPTEDRPKLKKALRRVFQTGEPAGYQTRRVGPRGTTSWYACRVGPIKRDGRVVALTLIASDITGQRRAVQALRESELRYRRLVEACPDAIVVHNGERLIYVNAAGVNLFGATSRDELIGKPMLDFIHPEYRQIVKDQLRRVQQEGEHAELMEQKFVRLDKRIINVEVTGIPITYLGKPATQVVIRDITYRKRAEELARKHRAELAHVYRINTMGEMAAGLAHELNQPLSAITIYAQECVRGLQSEAADQDELLDAVKQVSAESERASEIIRSLRNFVRKREPQRTAVDVNHAVREVTKLVEAETQQSNVAMQLKLAAETLQVQADLIQIEQVILNLVRNALEAMNGSSADCQRLTIETATAGRDTVEVAVHDTGQGLPPESTDHVFKPFFTTKPHGMGLGLAISRSIIRAHGGRLWATPNPDRGTTFRFTLPRAHNHGA